MKLKFKKYVMLFLSIFLFSNCANVDLSKTDNLSTSKTSLPKKDLNMIDLNSIKHIAPKGRAQDGSLEDINFVKLKIADDLLIHGKDCIPFLISKLEDENELKRGTVDFWYKVYVGDIALIILNDFFTKNDGLTSTISGFGWDDFLERGNDKDTMSEQLLRNYIEKYGRTYIKERWQKLWDENKENIVWDDTEKCFKLSK